MTFYKALSPRAILPRLYQWTVAWPRYPLESYLLETSDGAIAIDPQDAHPGMFKDVQSCVKHVFLTNHYHERAAAMWKHRFGATVWAPEGDVHELETMKPDEVYSQGMDLPGDLEAIALGGITAGEHALLWHDNRGVLFVGDALGTTSYWTHGERSVGAHPRIRPPTPLLALLDLQFTSLAVGHGEAILDQAKIAVERYLEAVAGGK